MATNGEGVYLGNNVYNYNMEANLNADAKRGKYETLIHSHE